MKTVLELMVKMADFGKLNANRLIPIWFCILFTGCGNGDDEQIYTCEGGLSDPDLTSNFEMLMDSVILGDPYEWQQRTKNNEDVNCQETMTARSNFNGVTVDYSPNPNTTDFQTVSFNEVSVSALPGGMQQIDLYETMFDVAGSYIINTMADQTEVVEERDETNNDDTSGNLMGRSDDFPNSHMVVVRPKPGQKIIPQDSVRVVIRRVSSRIEPIEE